MTINERLKVARKLLGFSQSGAAIGSGLVQRDISQLENGERKFIPNEYIQFLNKEGIDINSIFDYDVNVSLKEQLPLAEVSTFNETGISYGSLPPALKSQKIKIIDPPTDPPTPNFGVSAVYLAPQIITVDSQHNDNIVYVPVKAAAGYLTGYADATFIEKLPSFTLPGLRDKTYRAFEIDGDSMYPTLENKEMIIGERVEKLEYIREDRVHVLVTKNQGVIVKRLLNRIDKYGYVVCKSDAVNDRNLYPNIEVRPEDIVEIWYGVWHGGFSFKSPGDLWKRQNNLEADLTDIMRRLKEAGL